MRRTLLLHSALLASLALVPSVAHALPSTSALPPPTGLDGNEPVTDLGDYDPNPAAHPAYALKPATNVVVASRVGAIGSRLSNLGDIAAVDGLVLSDGTPSGSACPAPQATYDWDRTFSKSDDFGNSTFGAGYWAGIIFTSRAGRAGGADTFSGEGLLRGYVTVFGSDKELARISGKATLTGSQGTSAYYVRVLGVDVKSKSVSGNLSGNESLYDASFLEASKTIWLGPLPVKFTGAVRGTLGVSYLAQYATSTLSVTAKPNANLYAYASAGIDVWLASAGVSGSLSLIQAAVPGKASAVVSPNAVSWSLDSDLTLTSLSGQIDAYASLAGKKWRMCLAKWDPVFSGTYPIIHAHSCSNPIVRPVCGDHVCQSGETSYNCSADCGAPPPPPPPPPDDGPTSPLCRAKPWMCQTP